MHNFLIQLSRTTKRAILFSVDMLLVLVSLYAAFALRFGTPTPFEFIGRSWVLFPALLLVCGTLAFMLRLPSIKLNSFENNAVIRIGLCAVGISLAAMVISYILGLGAPRSVPLILGGAFFFGSTVARLLGYLFLYVLQNNNGGAVPVAVYGAGAAGIQLVSALRQSQEVKPVVFVDDNPALRGLLVAGLKVKSPDCLGRLAAKGKIKKVLLAVPSASISRRDEMMKRLEDLPLEVQVLPSYVDMFAGNGLEDSFRTVSPDELLGRDKVNLDIPDIAKVYAGRVVMVTGAGGSIGSELCRQLINCSPARIILFEQNEFGLFEIDRELRSMAERVGIDVLACLGSITDKGRVLRVMKGEGVEIVLHAAAYKHVPLVEENELEGARNNVIGTQTIAEAAIELGLERFILISTDKAVRPTNIMGATKRMAELVVQDLQTRSHDTKLTMVRFGNVLGSSGSVLPLFQQQIQAGGPVTVTHAEVTRFFMTIPEAARLVLLAGAYAKGGDVFVLDMGKSMKILDVAKRMITLSGRTIRDETNPHGDMEIVITKLRPGEKLYEELLINDENLKTTPHEKIMRAEENMLSQIEVAGMLKELLVAVSEGDQEKLRNLVEARVDGYHRQGEVA